MGWLWGTSDSQAEASKPSDETPRTASTLTAPSTNNSDQLKDTDRSKAAAAAADAQELLPIAFRDFSHTETDSADSAETSLYPSTLSCRELFDSAFYCQSFGGQFNNVYRYGGFRSCSEHWAAWRMCMRLKTLSPSEQQAKIRQYYKEREAKLKFGQSSEDVWKIRSTPLENAFSKDPDSW